MAPIAKLIKFEPIFKIIFAYQLHLVLQICLLKWSWTHRIFTFATIAPFTVQFLSFTRSLGRFCWINSAWMTSNISQFHGIVLILFFCAETDKNERATNKQRRSLIPRSPHAAYVCHMSVNALEMMHRSCLYKQSRINRATQCCGVNKSNSSMILRLVIARYH